MLDSLSSKTFYDLFHSNALIPVCWQDPCLCTKKGRSELHKQHDLSYSTVRKGNNIKQYDLATTAMKLQRGVTLWLS